MRLPRGDPQSLFGTVLPPSVPADWNATSLEGLASTDSSHSPSSSVSGTTTTTTAVSSTLSRLLSTLFPAVDRNSFHLTAAPSSEGFVVDRGAVVDINTPLNAPEPSLDPVTDPPLLGDSADLSDLGWIIPTTIVCIAAMLGVAFACYHGVRKLELCMLGWLYRNCSCCFSPGDRERGRLLRGEQYDTLSEETGKKGRKETVRLKGKLNE